MKHYTVMGKEFPNGSHTLGISWKGTLEYWMPPGLRPSWWWTLVGNYNRKRNRERKGAKNFLMYEISLQHGICLYNSYVCVYVNRKWIDKRILVSDTQILK